MTDQHKDMTIMAPEEISVTPEFVTISRRIPTRAYYEAEVASKTEDTLTQELLATLDQFLVSISYQIESAHQPERDTDKGPTQWAFSFVPYPGKSEPFPKDLPPELCDKDSAMRRESPLLSDLCDAWDERLPAMRQAYEEIAKAEQEYKLLDRQAWEIVHRDDPLDLGAYSDTTERRDQVEQSIAPAKKRYMGIVKEALAVIAEIACRHLEEAHDYAWGDLGLDAWVAEATGEGDGHPHTGIA